MSKKGATAAKGSVCPFLPRCSQAPMRRLNKSANVRYWPKADIGECTAHVRF